MRKWHRWVSVVFGVFLLWIAATGVASQVAALMAESEARPGPSPAAQAAQAMGDLVAAPAQAHEEGEDGDEDGAAASPPAAAAIAGAVPFTCPEGWRCIPKAPPGQGGMREWVGFFHHLHSGETFGPIGTAISILSGLALLFFSFSGLWMYVQMFTGRRKRDAPGGLFWK